LHLAEYQSEYLIPEVSYENNTFEFVVSSIGYNNEVPLEYSFYLEGYDDDWTVWAPKNIRRYTNLYEGKYKLRVCSKDIFGNISKEAIYSFVIEPPWYRTIWAYIGYILLLILIVWTAIKIATVRLRVIIKKATTVIQIKNKKLIQQKEEIEEIHHEISESINYATRLQDAILPEENILEKYLSEHFLLFKPKDKVSGDFYWWANVKNHTIITAADCTGHGVPGAFMSMLGTSFLREIVQKEYITHTGVILHKLRKEIIKALKQKGEVGEQKDGMDMAIISINHETNMVQFSGAYNPLYILSSKELISLKPLEVLGNFYEIKPDKMPIAIYDKMDSFTSHEIQLEKGDQLFMFSDGYADQFGGPKGKKFKYKPFKRLLSDNKDKPMSEQKELLNSAFEAWRGDLEQVDDVVVVGVKI